MFKQAYMADDDEDELEEEGPQNFEEGDEGQSDAIRDRTEDEMIITDQNNSDQNKVVYFSNINSCSLPQTPKQDNTIESQISQKTNMEKKVFDYQPGNQTLPNQFFSNPLSSSDQVHQQISLKPSLESNTNSDVATIVDDKYK